MVLFVSAFKKNQGHTIMMMMMIMIIIVIVINDSLMIWLDPDIFKELSSSDL